MLNHWLWNRIRQNALPAITAALFVIVALTLPSNAYAEQRDFPLLSLYYVDCCFTSKEAEDIAKFDLVILTMEAQEYNASGIKKLRTLNPDIIIIPYVPSQGVDFNSPSNTRQKMIDRIEGDDWYLTRPDGTRISRYPGEQGLNITRTDVRQAMVDFIKTDLYNKKCGGVRCWDGVFYDVVEDNLDYLGDLDPNQDGIADTDVNAQWISAYRKLFKRTRTQLGDDAYIIINGVSNESMQTHVNGRMFESFPTPWHADGSWQGVTENTPTLQNLNSAPTAIIYSGEGKRKQYKRVRYTIASSMIMGTYGGYDNGVDKHNSIWVYDEYNYVLGAPTGDGYNVRNPNKTDITNGVWRRDFEKGIALVNSTDKQQTIRLDQGFEKIRGEQAKKINDGSLTGTVTLKPNDGLILLRRATQLDNAPYINGAFARVFDDAGESARTSFFPFDRSFAGGSTVVELPDVNKTVVAGDTYVEVYSNGRRTARFAPYGENFRSGVNIAVERINGPRKAYRIVTGTKAQGPHVRIFTMKGKVANHGCFPYAEDFRGGVNVAVGDVDKKNRGQEIIVAVAQGGGPHIRILDRNCRLISPGFFAYDQSMGNGVSIGVGDINADGKDEIVTIPGAGAAPHVRVFNKNGREIRPGFFAYDQNDRSGASVSLSDVEGDGTEEIIVMSYSIFNF